MSIQDQLIKYAMQLVEDRKVAEEIVKEAMIYGIDVGFKMRNGRKGQIAMIVETRNRCYEYIRGQEQQSPA